MCRGRSGALRWLPRCALPPLSAPGRWHGVLRPPPRRDQLRRRRRPRGAWERLRNDDDALVFVRVAVSAPLREAFA